MSGEPTVALQLELADVRFKLQAFPTAADDLEHVLVAQAVLHGKGSKHLIPTLETLCKVRLILHEWQPALDAISQGARARARKRIWRQHLVGRGVVLGDRSDSRPS